jgi:hypothetical protein
MLSRTVLLLIACLPAAAQFRLLVTPWSLGTTDAVFANRAAAIGIWDVSICLESSTAKSIQRPQILMAVPQLRVLSNDIAEDLLTRRAKSSKWALLGRYGATALQFAPAAVSLWGATTGNNSLVLTGSASGLGLSLLTLGVDRAKERAPNPSAYFERFLPNSIELVPGECESYLLAAGLMQSAAPIGPISVGAPVQIGAVSREDVVLAKILRARLAAGFAPIVEGE